ncbi:MAG: hypothetical protein JWO36_5442 [Myxococcales bacterium]|nr:hypothetical protein [Myxococcales bacterium]
MHRPKALAAILAITAPVATAAADPWLEKYPGFLDAGMYVRHFAAPLDSGVAFRTATPTAAQGADSGYAGDLRFGMRFPHNVRLGIEGEFGQLTRPGSNVAGAYTFAGLEGILGGISLGAEIAGGTRTIRYSLSDTDKSIWLVEPRVHAELWLGRQISLGAIGGATLGGGDQNGRSVTMFGLYLGVHSLFDRAR